MGYNEVPYTIDEGKTMKNYEEIKKTVLFGVSLATGSVVSAFISSRVPVTDTTITKIVRWVGVFALNTAVTRVVDREILETVEELEAQFNSATQNQI